MENSAVRYPVDSSSPCPYSNYVINAFCWERRLLDCPLWSEKYLTCSESAARFRVAEKFLARVVKLKLTPKIVFHGKDVVKAEAFRQRGNRLFAGGDLPGALAAYNESIIHAPFQDKGCIVLALGNRSAVFFRLERYAECIRDIEQAVMLGYPLVTVKKLLVRKAKAFLAVSQPLAAIYVLEKEGISLKVCSGSVEEICELEGDMRDYAEVLALALRKQKEDEENETRDVDAHVNSKTELRPKYLSGWDKREETVMLRLRDGEGRKFSCLSSSVSFSCYYDPNKLWIKFDANRDLDAGDVLLKEPAFVSALQEPALLTNCVACLCWTDTPFPCSKCSTVVFCSPACASGPKGALHARECALWQTVSFSDEIEHATNFPRENKSSLLALRLLLRKPAEEWLILLDDKLKSSSEMPSRLNKGRHRDDELMDVLWLTSFGESKLSRDAIGAVSGLVAFVAIYLTKMLETVYLTGVTLERKKHYRLGGMVIDALAMFSRETGCAKEMLGPPAKGFFPVADVLHPVYSQMAKSCDPNLFGVHYGDIFVVRARRPIRKGEALTTPYLFPDFARLCREERQLALTSYGRNACKCRACEENWPMLDELQAEHAAFLCKLKCPFCSHVLGKFGGIMERPEVLFKGCPKCKTKGHALHSNVTTILRQYCLEEVSAVPCSPYDTPDELFGRIRALRSIYVEPAHALVEADKFLQQALLRGGNKRFDKVIPYPVKR